MTESKKIKIIRVQNLRLWRKCDAHKRVVCKNNRKVNEKEMFHGTRGNDQTLIYEDGFDTRLSAQAASAVYAHGFAHRTADGHKEIFLTKVAAGNSCSARLNISKTTKVDLQEPIMTQLQGLLLWECIHT